jgi:hypothetical protein
MWGKDAAGNFLSGRRDLEHQESEIHPLQEPRRTEHGTEDGGRNRAHPAGGNEAWAVFRGGQGGRVQRGPIRAWVLEVSGQPRGLLVGRAARERNTTQHKGRYFVSIWAKVVGSLVDDLATGTT